MRTNLITRLKEEWNNLDPVDPLRGLIADAIDALAEAQPSKLRSDVKPLADEQIKLIMDGRGEEGDDDYVKPAFDPFGISEDDLMNFVRAIEAAHGITGEQK